MSERLTAPQMAALRVLGDAETFEYHGSIRVRPITPTEMARHLWPDSKGWNVRSHRGSTPAGGAMGATMGMKAATLLWRMQARGVASHSDGNQWRITLLGERVLAGTAEPLPSPVDPRRVPSRGGGPKPPRVRKVRTKTPAERRGE